SSLLSIAVLAVLAAAAACGGKASDGTSTAGGGQGSCDGEPCQPTPLPPGTGSQQPSGPVQPSQPAPPAHGAVLFAGDGPTFFDDMWIFDGAAWTSVPSSQGPSSRVRHAMTAQDGKVLLFGGAHVNEPVGDTWAWDGVAWAQVATTGPSARLDHAMAALGDSV